ncbi:ATP-dependent Clp protease adapter ClpS [Nitrosophilus kaiyonis]|uniref:ATP-dependent Clp protease adapter ClpS n=1 Tax=Nitrosophilus kaiyonis TaxID=2930200 RepID=UPI002491ED35|nr:ATP-dependent Clp protease adapter ClpS [Nitrosophilus kaiyonis]
MAVKKDTQTKEITKTKEPKLYKVFLLNDDYTTMDFVVEILCDIFHKSYEEAVQIMLLVHKNGKGLCGVYTYEIAETKIDEVHRRARANDFPLKAIMEEL